MPDGDAGSEGRERVARPLAGKVAVVTGASRGIGRAIATRLGRDGALVAVHYGRSRDAATEVVAEIEGLGGEAFAVAADLGATRVTAAVEGLFQALDAELRRRRGDDRFDILVNNAGVAPLGGIADTPEPVFDEVFTINAKAPFFITQLALPRLRDGGRIIYLSSVVNRIAVPTLAAYAMTKAALDALALTLAKQLGPRGITVNSLAPGIIETDMSAAVLGGDGARVAAGVAALGRIGRPQDIADAAAFLAAEESRWITGQVVEASGGTSLGLGA
ncbi:MAG TPA: SDR family oxidoreductase [Gemmatimonadales bacterium]|nr:SDR family oxidoreductase [Gemmatimonadales bacterium]